VTELLLARHGETDWNAERRWQGHADLPLNERGRGQARALAEDLAADERIDIVYSSDLARARETASIVADRLGLELVLEPDLREIAVGSRQGRTWIEIDDGPDWDGEPIENHARRIIDGLVRVARWHEEGRVLVVTHGGSMRRVYEHLDLPQTRIPNCAVWACCVHGETFIPSPPS
jgi:broad specificity phosphatase PhoE